MAQQVSGTPYLGVADCELGSDDVPNHIQRSLVNAHLGVTDIDCAVRADYGVIQVGVQLALHQFQLRIGYYNGELELGLQTDVLVLRVHFRVVNEVGKGGWDQEQWLDIGDEEGFVQGRGEQVRQGYVRGVVQEQ